MPYAAEMLSDRREGLRVIGLTLEDVALAGIFRLDKREGCTKVGDRNGRVGTEDVSVVRLRLEQHRFGKVPARGRIDEEVEVRPNCQAKSLVNLRSGKVKELKATNLRGIRYR